MKHFITLLLVFASVTAIAQIKTVAVGAVAPAFNLKNVDGKTVSFENFKNAKGYIIVFTCNTCPVSKAYEQRIIELNNKYASNGFPVIAINPNDPEVSRGDTYDKMQALASNKNYAFPYLYDEGQTITNAYGARNTPHVFIVSKTSAGNVVSYTGAIDNDPENTNPDKTKYVEQVIAALSKNEKPPYSQTKAIGCSVKRKS